MDTIADLIDAAKKRTGANYTDIGERLDRSKQLITNWRSGAKVPTDGDVMALARMAGENADKWLAVAQAARTEGEAKARWEHIARRLAATAAMALCVMATTLPGTAKAATAGFQAATQVGNVYYVHLRWAWHLVSLWLGSRLRKPARPYIEARI